MQRIGMAHYGGLPSFPGPREQRDVDSTRAERRQYCVLLRGQSVEAERDQATRHSERPGKQEVANQVG